MEYLNRATSIFKMLSGFAILTACALLLKKSTGVSFALISVVDKLKILGSFVVCALSAIVALRIEKKVIPLFYFTDHVHADID